MATRGQHVNTNAIDATARRQSMPATNSGVPSAAPGGERDNETTPMYEPVVRAEQIAPMLDCSSKTVLRMAKAGQIPAVQIGKLWRFRRSAIDAWLAAHLEHVGTHHAGKLECPGHPRVAQEVEN